MITRLLRFLLVLLVVRFVWSLVVTFMRRPRSERDVEPPSGGALVRDPVCGVYVLRERSIREGDLYFCSSDCHLAFRAKHEVSA